MAAGPDPCFSYGMGALLATTQGTTGIAALYWSLRPALGAHAKLKSCQLKDTKLKVTNIGTKLACAACSLARLMTLKRSKFATKEASEIANFHKFWCFIAHSAVPWIKNRALVVRLDHQSNFNLICLLQKCVRLIFWIFWDHFKIHDHRLRTPDFGVKGMESKFKFLNPSRTF